MEGRVTFYAERREIGHIRWLDLTSSWENDGFGDEGNFFVSHKRDTIERLRPFSLPSPSPPPRRVVLEMESNRPEQGVWWQEESEKKGEELEGSGQERVEEEKETGFLLGEDWRGHAVFGL